ncbi:hypothetical protein FRB94_009044 [Tulasnella sp. JGI-2019a]|nr:hypothetical protein FRB94_009044 [Tulasnella sp. JGI-2019a]KAG9039952.1 hypothetical protein FRB95_004424 [Tulasnella sp. JGI-2019a]
MMKTFTLSLGLLSGLVALSLAQDTTTPNLASASADDKATIAQLTDVAPATVGDLNITNIVVTTVLSGIDFSSLGGDTATTAFEGMAQMADTSTTNATTDTGTSRKRAVANSGSIDVHAHAVFPWYGLLVPKTGGETTPQWSVESHLQFMASENISHTILSPSAPGANVFLGSQAATIALARLLNINLAVLSAFYPDKFSWYAVVPLPYTTAAIAEATFALDTLGATGLILYSNYEGLYLGDPVLAPFFTYLQSHSKKTVVFVHPTEPVLRQNNGTTFVDCNPTSYPSGIAESYFEMARTLQDMSWTLGVVNYTQITYVISNLGGGFTGIMDRMLKTIITSDPLLEPVYRTRFYWDSAGPTYPNQIQGVLGYGIPTSQFVFGTDYPFSTPAEASSNLQGITTDTNSQIVPAIPAILRSNAAGVFSF